MNNIFTVEENYLVCVFEFRDRIKALADNNGVLPFINDSGITKFSMQGFWKL